MNCNESNCGCAANDAYPQIPRKPRPTRALKPDAQAFDEVRILTKPRFKDSHLSGCEWRISAEIEFYRKGKLIFTQGCSNVENACYLVGSMHMTATDNALGHFAGEGNICDQEGCSAEATVTYRVKKEFSRDNPHEWNKPIEGLTIRKFCDRHRDRGDSSCDDCDENYERIELKEE